MNDIQYISILYTCMYLNTHYIHLHVLILEYLNIYSKYHLYLNIWIFEYLVIFEKLATPYKIFRLKYTDSISTIKISYIFYFRINDYI